MLPFQSLRSLKAVGRACSSPFTKSLYNGTFRPAAASLCFTTPYRQVELDTDSPLFRLLRRYSTSEKSEPEAKKPPAWKENIWTIPNALTAARVAVTPIIGYATVAQDYEMAFGLFFIAGLSDMADGIIARRFPSQRSILGAAFDPFADKVLMITAVTTMGVAGLIPESLVALIVARDAGLLLSSFYIRYKSLLPHLNGEKLTLKKYFQLDFPTVQVNPTSISKVNTVLQLGLVTFSYTHVLYDLPSAMIMQLFWYSTAATTIGSGMSYILSKDAIQYLDPNLRKKLQN